MVNSISVILPFYNNSATLSRSVESILDQTHEDFELILIDNNSTDESYEIASEYAAKESRIKLIREPEQGIVFALNTGIKACSGKYIARMDADDVSYPDRLEKQFKFLESNPDTDFVACCVKYVGDIDSQYGFYEYVQWNNRLITHSDIFLNRFVESPIIHPTAMFRKELPEKYGAYRQGDFPEDYELWLRWLQAGVKIHKIQEILVEWHDSEERLTRTDSRYSTLAFFEIKTTFLHEWLRENNAYYPKTVVWGAGRKSRQRFALLHDLGIIPKFFIDLHANPDRNVIEYKHTPPAGRHFIVSYVSNRNAREKIREFLVDLGYSEGRDFICVA